MPDALPPLPPHPDGVWWPTLLWPVADLTVDPTTDTEVDTELLERQVKLLFNRRQAGRLGETQALLVAHHGRVVAERYAAGVAANHTLISWSTAKSMLHAVVGILVGRGLLDLDEPAPVPEWSDPADPRHTITLRQLLEFRSGLQWIEDYVDGVHSDVIEMLFASGQHDVAAFAAAKPLDHEPGTTFCYSSGTSNIVARIVRDVIVSDEDVDAGDPTAVTDAYRAFLHRELFDRIGMRTAKARFDDTGTWLASSYVFCTARDFARFATLYLRDGMWKGGRILPAGWVDVGRTPTSVDLDGQGHGAHWWMWDEVPGAFSANGYEGQYLIVVPHLDLVVVRLGKTVAELRPNLRLELTGLIEAFAG